MNTIPIYSLIPINTIYSIWEEWDASPITNSNKDQKPSYQDCIIFIGVTCIQKKVTKAVIMVSSIAKTNALLQQILDTGTTIEMDGQVVGATLRTSDSFRRR